MYHLPFVSSLFPYWKLCTANSSSMISRAVDSFSKSFQIHIQHLCIVKIYIYCNVIYIKFHKYNYLIIKIYKLLHLVLDMTCECGMMSL